MNETPGKDCSGGEEEADGLIAMEEAALGIAAGDALLLGSVAFQFVIHDLNCNGQYSGGWERLETRVFGAYSSGAKALLLFRHLRHD